MRTLRFMLLAVPLLAAPKAPSPARQTWDELLVKRAALASFHQEFQVSRTAKFAQGGQSAVWSIVLDAAPNAWRETVLSGSEARTSIWNGTEITTFEEGGDEYVRSKELPAEKQTPDPYALPDPNWAKATERERRPCHLEKLEHECVVLDVPLGPRPVAGSARAVRVLGGMARLLLDTQTGLLLSAQQVQSIDNGRGGYQLQLAYQLVRMSYGGTKEETLFRLAPGVRREVKELSPWNAPRIQKQLAGKPAPDFTFTDLDGKLVKLSALKGRTVLLDFWTTWCGPCRADAPALDKLYRKYRDGRLTIIGISVSEDRAIVKKFLSEHPHEYPIVLTSENEMPRTYQLGVFPTYIVIDRNGNLFTATQGDQGFAELRKLLKKAGLESE